MAVGSRSRTTIWFWGGDVDSESPGDVEAFEVHSEDDMLMIEGTERGGTGNQVEILIGPSLFPRIKEVIRQLEDRR